MSNQHTEKDIIENFCVLASELHNDWVFHVTMFARNKDTSVLENPSLIFIFDHLLNVTHENLILKWAKLHDPAQQTRGYCFPSDLVGQIKVLA